MMFQGAPAPSCEILRAPMRGPLFPLAMALSGFFNTPLGSVSATFFVSDGVVVRDNGQ